MVLVMGGFIIPISTMGEPAEFALRHDLGVLRARSARRWRRGGPGFSETGRLQKSHDMLNWDC